MFGVSDTSEAGGRGGKKNGEGERREREKGGRKGKKEEGRERKERSAYVEREKEGEEAEGCHGQERSWDRSECTHGEVARVAYPL